MERTAEQVLAFWFGRVEETLIPTQNRARIWFGETPEVDQEIKQQFGQYVQNAIDGDYKSWEDDPHGQLALILLFDQFSRHIYRDSEKAFAHDDRALQLCVSGLHNEADRHLSLIERVFYYFPLLHAEDIKYQAQSLQMYQMLDGLALPETKGLYDSFLNFANHHYVTIERFGRFPQRNEILGRASTDEELVYLKEIEVDKK